MPEHIGIVGCSAEGAALCYKTICVEAQKLMGAHRHPEVSMHTPPLERYMVAITTGDWDSVGRIMADSASKLAQIGAEFAICPDNTVHRAFDMAVAHSPIPWLHIADEVAAEAKKQGYRQLGILGTVYTMTGPVYPFSLEKQRIRHETPNEPDRFRIDQIIMDELVHGVFTEPSRQYYNKVIQKFKTQGCDAAVLGCTEIPLLVDPNDCPLSTLDSTRILAQAAIRRSLSN